MLAHWQSSLVLLARDAKGFASVCYDDEGAIKILMQRLYDQGHRNISYLGVPHSDVTTVSDVTKPTWRSAKRINCIPLPLCQGLL